jgi:GNAT superfamily N-acetyltransferase
LYLLGDLEPEFFARGAWWCGENAVTLIYRGFDPPILAAAGGDADVGLLLDEMPRPAQLYLHVQPHIATLVRRHYRIPEQRIMLRMALAENDFRPVASGGARRLAAADASALLRLYGDGNVAGESPGFFAPEMIEQGVYYGIDQNDALVAVAGTHLVSDAESVAAIGNVYTRRDCRGRALGALTTTAVASELFRRGVRTVALSVNERNAGAIRVYERLGFRFHCRFVEGVAILADAIT